LSSLEDNYFPVEVSVLVFNFKDGIQDFFHSFIDPGNIDRRFFGSIMHKYEMNGLLEVESTEKNYEVLWENLKRIFDFNESKTHPQRNIFSKKSNN